MSTSLRQKAAAKRVSLSGRLNGRRPRSHVEVGRGLWIDRRATLNASPDGPITIGDGVQIFRFCELQGPVTIGQGTFLNRNVYVRPNTTIGENVAIGPFSNLVTDSHEIGPSSQRAGARTFRPIHIADGAWLGAQVTVLGGVTIGPGAVVAAGSVVTKDVPSNVLVGGVPARVIRELDE